MADEANVGDSLPGTEEELIRQAAKTWGLAEKVYGKDVVAKEIGARFGDPFPKEERAAEATRASRNADLAGGPDQARPVPGPLEAALGFFEATHDPRPTGPAGQAALKTAEQLGMPVGGGVAGGDAAIKAQAAKESGSAPAYAGDPRDLLEQPQQQRLLGYTKGGFQPTTNSRSAQTERKAMPPEWYDALRAFTDSSRVAAEGQAIGGSELARIQADAAAKRSQMLARQAETEQEALALEDRARQAAELRIQAALQDYANSAPRAENYGTLFEGASPGKRIAGIFGSLLGIFGGAMSGQPSQWTKQLDSMIERRARAAEANSRVKGQLVGAAENAYARLEQSFGDQRAARSSLRAIYAEEAKAAMEQQAAELGISMENPKLQAALAAIEEKRLGYLKDTASTVVESARADERYVPPQAIVSTPTGMGGMDAGLSKEQRDELRAFGKILREEGIPQARAAVALMKEASDEIGEDSTFWANVASANPGTISQLYTRFSSPAQQKYLSAYNDFLANKSGKAVTQSEGSRFTALLGRGDRKSRETAIGIMDSGLQGQIRTLQETGWDEQSQTWQRHKAYNDQRGRSGLDIRGVPSPQSATEPPPVQK